MKFGPLAKRTSCTGYRDGRMVDEPFAGVWWMLLTVDGVVGAGADAAVVMAVVGARTDVTVVVVVGAALLAPV